jgi:hypothetical protein
MSGLARVLEPEIEGRAARDLSPYFIDYVTDPEPATEDEGDDESQTGMVGSNLGLLSTTGNLRACLMGRGDEGVWSGLIIMRLKDWHRLPRNHANPPGPQCLMWMPGLPLPSEGPEAVLSYLRGLLD